MLAPRPETHEWPRQPDSATAGADRLLAACRDELEGAQVLEMLQARVEALLKGECEPDELAARSVALQCALQSLAGAGLVSAPLGLTMLPTAESVAKDRRGGLGRELVVAALPGLGLACRGKVITLLCYGERPSP